MQKSILSFLEEHLCECGNSFCYLNKELKTLSLHRDKWSSFEQLNRHLTLLSGFEIHCCVSPSVRQDTKFDKQN